MKQSYAKEVWIEENAKKEFYKFPRATRESFTSLIKELGDMGELEYPNARKLSGYDLFEMRVKDDGIYRCIYSYIKDNIVILCAFKKKTQKTPENELTKAIKRKINLM